jgi:serine/threonine protein phosphatase 1
MVALRWLACAPQGGRHYRVPADRVVYAVGDIHGRCDLLAALLTGVEQHARQSGYVCHVVVFLGDYLSRGLDSRAVLERVRTWRPDLPDLPGRAKVVALKGNHEDLALRFLGGDLEAGRHWFDYGGLSALAHYGVVAPDPLARDVATLMALRQGFEQALPPEHLAFLRDLAISHREFDYCFVHAGVRPGVALADQTAHDQMWIRKRFLESHAEHGAMIVHGHSIHAEPEVHANRIGIDTGAYASGVLTCLVLDGAQRAFLQAVGPAMESTAAG